MVTKTLKCFSFGGRVCEEWMSIKITGCIVWHQIEKTALFMLCLGHSKQFLVEVGRHHTQKEAASASYLDGLQWPGGNLIKTGQVCLLDRSPGSFYIRRGQIALFAWCTHDLRASYPRTIYILLLLLELQSRMLHLSCSKCEQIIKNGQTVICGFHVFLIRIPEVHMVHL